MALSRNQSLMLRSLLNAANKARPSTNRGVTDPDRIKDEEYLWYLSGGIVDLERMAVENPKGTPNEHIDELVIRVATYFGELST